MKYCANCGSQLTDDCVFCGNCGYRSSVTNTTSQTNNESLRTIAKIFMIIGTVAGSLMGFLIPLAWCLPMTLYYFKCVKENRPVSTGFAVCTLIFVNTISGVLMLIDKQN